MTEIHLCGCDPYQLKFQLKLDRRVLDAVHSSPSISCANRFWKFHRMIFQPFRLVHGIYSKFSELKLKINIQRRPRETLIRLHCTYRISSIIAGDFALMIGINVSTIHWFAQSHCQLLKRKSISSTSSQRPSKSCGSVDKLLLYKMSCAKENRTFNMCRQWHNKTKKKWKAENMRTDVMGGHSSWFGFSLPGRPKARSSMVDNCGLLCACTFCNATKLLNAPAPICVSFGMNEKLRCVSLGNNGNTPPLLQSKHMAKPMRAVNHFDWLMLMTNKSLLIGANFFENIVVQIQRDDITGELKCVGNLRE